MSFPIYFEFSGWYILLVVAAALGIASLLYWKNKILPYPYWLKSLLFLLRFLVVLLLGILLLKPYLLQKIKSIDQPLIVLAHDNSASIISNSDSAFYQTDYLEKLDSVYTEIEQQFLSESLGFGQSVSDISVPAFTEKQTNIAALFATLKKKYFRRNLGAVVLFSDGINNSGLQPDLAVANFPFKIHTVGLGDTVSHPDLSVYDVRYNRKVLKNSSFPIEINIRAQDASEQAFKVMLFMDNEKIEEQILKPLSDRFSRTIMFLVKSGDPGYKNLEIRIEPLDNEKNQANNRKQFFVEVIDQKQKILVVARAPHPDLGAIQSALGEQYSVEFEYNKNKLKSNNQLYDLIIFHQLPDGEVNAKDLNNFLLSQPKTPVLWVIGQQTNNIAFNAIQQFIHSSGNFDNLEQAYAQYNPGFSVFKLNPQTIEQINLWPPLNVPFSDLTFNSPVETLFYQKLRGVETERPLLLFGKDQDRKSGLIYGTGIWSWRLHDYKRNGSHVNFDALLQQIIRYLSLQTDNSLLKVLAEDRYLNGAPVMLKTELRNKSGELIWDIPLTVTLNHEQEDRTYSFELIPNPPFYSLNAGYLTEGVYSYEITGRLGEEDLKATGRFVVEGSSIENSMLEADWSLLNRIATHTGGNFYTINDMQRLVSDLKEDETMASISRTEKSLDKLINFQLLLFMLLLLLATEWFLRKFYGSY